MDVDQAPRVTANELGCQYPHEAGQHDDRRIMTIDFLRQRPIELFAGRITAMVDDTRRDPCLPRDAQAAGIGAVADHRGDRRAELCTPALLARCAKQGFKIAAAARDQYDDVLHYTGIVPVGPA